MVEKEIQREKEAEAPALTHYDASLLKMNKVIDQARSGLKVIKAKNKPWAINRQGITRKYADLENL